MVLSVLLDAFLVSNLSVSVKMGVNGIAVTNIIVNITILIVSASASPGIKSQFQIKLFAIQ